MVILAAKLPASFPFATKINSKIRVAAETIRRKTSIKVKLNLLIFHIFYLGVRGRGGGEEGMSCWEVIFNFYAIFSETKYRFEGYEKQKINEKNRLGIC